MRITLNRINDAVHFETKNEDGAAIHIDGSPDVGGENKGMRPMQLLLSALGGCSAIDIVNILKKQRQKIGSFQIIVDGEREKDVTPAVWQTVQIHFILTGKINKAYLKRAVELSVEKYCSVAKTMKAAGAVITYTISLNETKI